MCANSTTRTPSSGSTESFGQAGDRNMAVDRLGGNRLRQDLARDEQLLQVDAGLDAHALEHEHQVLGDHVAARAGREGAAAEAAHRAVEVAHAFLVGGEGIGEAEAARVVQVSRFELRADSVFDFSEYPANLGRICVTDGVRKRHAVAEL